MASITIGVPVFDGQDLITETLRSIRDQTFEDYSVLISVDGEDQDSARACEPFLDDARFSMTVQPRRLGWAGNLNWLMAQGQSDFFCYWQQDDLADIFYLEKLLRHGRAHPEAACSYSDLQWFGARISREKFPSVTGEPPLTRALTTLNSKGQIWLPFRGLVRRDALSKAGPLDTTHAMSSLEDMVWIVKLARAGELHRVPDILYFKRAHKKALHNTWHDWPDDRRRAAWIQHGLGLLGAILPAATSDKHGWLLDLVFTRLMSAEHWRLYDAAHEAERFHLDLIQAVRSSDRFASSLPSLLSGTVSPRKVPGRGSFWRRFGRRTK